MSIMTETDHGSRVYTYPNNATVELDPPVAQHAAYEIAAQAVGMSNFDKETRWLSFRDGEEPWRWSREQYHQDHCRRMGILAALKARADNLTASEVNDAIGILLGVDQAARSSMAETLRCPNGTDTEFIQAARYVETWWQTIACLAELLYEKGIVDSDAADGMMRVAMFGGGERLRFDKPHSYVIGSSWDLGVREGAAR